MNTNLKLENEKKALDMCIWIQQAVLFEISRSSHPSPKSERVFFP